MCYSLVLLAATCAVVDTNDVIRPVAATTQPAPVVAGDGGCGCGCPESHSFLARLRERFGGHECDCRPKTHCRTSCPPCTKPCNPCTKSRVTCQPCRTPCTPCRPCTNPCNPCETRVTVCTPCQGDPCAGTPQLVQKERDVKPAYVKRTAIADDGSWVVGQLFYVHEDGGTWILRYAPLSREDKYGGEVVLAHGLDMKEFREGDLAYVTGEFLKEGRASKYVGGPLYRPFSIKLNERID
jgi:hypothetical protein